jgi:hypothetical protein
VALITPLDLVIYLDYPTDTQPNDRTNLVCDLVIDAINQVAKTTLTAPFAAGLKPIALAAAARMYQNPSGLWSESIDDYSTVYPGSRTGTASAVLTEGERAAIVTALGLAGPQYSFPEPDWHWTTVATVLPD